MKIKVIKSIKIEKIKGIDVKKLDLGLLPNKPNIIVAPNGFGKSSLAVAFKSLKPSKIKLNKIDCYEENESNKPKIEIEIINDNRSAEIFYADDESNAIKNKFNYFVINNSLTPKSKSQNRGSYHSQSASLEIPTIVLKKTIPEVSYFTYSINEQRRVFGQNGKILVNLDDLLLNKNIIIRVFTNENFKKLWLKTISNKIKAGVEEINKLKGNSNDLKRQINRDIFPKLEDIIPLKELAEILQDNTNLDELDSYLSIIQFIKIKEDNKSNFQKIIKYYKYKKFKSNVAESLSSLIKTWKDIKPIERGGQLLVEFPDARNISNGERDTLSFLGNLLRIEEELNKNKSTLLIIDEVFDYLDDANLIICQYYISKFIEKFKKEENQIFPIILTHLNPFYFKNYIFGKQKVFFLEKDPTFTFNKDLSNIIFKRKEDKIEYDLGRFFFHFHEDNCDKSQEFENLGLNKELGYSNKLKEHMEIEFKKYIENENKYDPLSVCCHLRIIIEKYVYYQFDNNADKDGFINTHGTKAKLNFALKKGINIPEIFYLLGVIYNELLHLNNPNNDWITPIRSKLENHTIKNMIIETTSLDCN